MENIEFLAKLGSPQSKLKGEFLFQQGDESDAFYVLNSGLLKAFYITYEGKEFVKSIISPGEFIGSLTACYQKSECSFNLVCLKNCEYIEIRFSALMESAAKNPKVAQFMVGGLLNLAMKKERREYELLCLSAEQRYQLLQEHSPAFLSQLTQNDVARYLGITPVALSRIKNRNQQ